MVKKGDYVTRISYNNDTLFEVINIRSNVVYLKGVDYRLFADAPMNDCIVVDKKQFPCDFEPPNNSGKEMRSEYFYLPGKILHLDGDADYLKRCLAYYKSVSVYAVGKKIDEDTIAQDIRGYLEDARPDIVVITGHDAYYRNKGNKKDITNYKNSINFVNAVKQARKYEKGHDKLVIVAGACQSNYEDLIKAGANFASSPARVNIHALDPAIIASNVALTERNKEIDLLDLLNKTKNGKDGMGGLICNGLMYVGFPR